MSRMTDLIIIILKKINHPLSTIGHIMEEEKDKEMMIGDSHQFCLEAHRTITNNTCINQNWKMITEIRISIR